MRGKLNATILLFFFPGLIPAYAGKTVKCVHILRWPWAHPRVCGENMLENTSTLGAMGSSPRMRGKRGPPFVKVGRAGLIPAYAGKTTAYARRSALAAAHPRVCGENVAWDVGTLS